MRVLLDIIMISALGYALVLLLSQAYINIEDNAYWRGRKEEEAYRKEYCYQAHRDCLDSLTPSREKVEMALAERKYKRQYSLHPSSELADGVE